MNMHPNDEELLGFIYGLEPSNEHVVHCSECRLRIADMQDRRRTMDRMSGEHVDANLHLLAEQRRALQARIEAETSVWFPIRRWAPVALMLLLLTGGGVAVLERGHSPMAEHVQAGQRVISDDELAQQVSQIANDPEPSAAAPIEGLFED